MSNKNEIMTISGIECYEKDGTAYLKLETVARGLGFTKTETKNETEYTTIRWERVFGFLGEIGFDHKWAKDGYIPENIFYRLAMKAKNEAAERFQAKVADEIIPSIRRTGMYAAMPKDYPSALRALADTEEKRLALEAENEQQRQQLAEYKPIVQYVDTILESQGTMATTQIAADYGISARKLNKILHEEGIQHNVNGQWILYRRHMGFGYTKSQTIPIIRSDGRPDTIMHTHWTQKGRLLIHNILAERGIIPEMDKPA